LDPKHDFTIPGVPIVRSYSPFLKRQILRAPINDNENDVYLNAVKRAFRRGNIIIYFDEILYHTNTRTLPREIKIAVRMGRSKNVGVWTGSQSPCYIPNDIFTQSEHFFLNRLTYEGDRKKVLRFTDERLEPYLSSLRGWDSLYYNIVKDDVLLMRAKEQMQ
jgi:hypothetical protein